MTVRLLVGDCRAMLATLPDASVHCCVTSPPFYQLRSYLPDGHAAKPLELGSEATVEAFVGNLVAVFGEVRRVLHPSGTLVLNLGSSYAGSGKGPSNSLQRACSSLNNRQLDAGAAPTDWQGVSPGFKSKDLMMTPFFVAEALRQDGWYLRSAMPWLKRAAMPESVTDRPSNALEWLFLFSKAPRYFWDAEAVRVGNAASTLGRWGESQERLRPGNGIPNWVPMHGEMTCGVNPAGRAFRNTDPWFLSLDAAIADARADLARLEAMRATGGVLTDDDGLPLAVDINPAAFAQAHFATYPPALVIPFVRAGSSSRGACPRCLVPWTRVVDRGELKASTSGNHRPAPCKGSVDPARNRASGMTLNGFVPNRSRDALTVNWQPSCACDAGEPIPCTVLDPFAGSGTTLLVADRLGRDAVGVELSPEYARMAQARLDGDAPLFEVAEVETAGDYAPLGLFEEVAG